jgi:hypothetical protein
MLAMHAAHAPMLDRYRRLDRTAAGHAEKKDRNSICEPLQPQGHTCKSFAFPLTSSATDQFPLH